MVWVFVSLDEGLYSIGDQITWMEQVEEFLAGWQLRPDIWFFKVDCPKHPQWRSQNEVVLDRKDQLEVVVIDSFEVSLATDWVYERRDASMDVFRLKGLLIFFFDGKKVLACVRLMLAYYTLSYFFKGIKRGVFCGMIEIFVPLPSKKVVGDDCT